MNPEQKDKALQLMEFIGQLLRFGTPIMIVLIGTIYHRDQELQQTRSLQLLEKIDENSEVISSINTNIKTVGQTLAERGVQLKNIEGNVSRIERRVDAHESRIRALEISPRNN